LTDRRVDGRPSRRVLTNEFVSVRVCGRPCVRGTSSIASIGTDSAGRPRGRFTDRAGADSAVVEPDRKRRQELVSKSPRGVRKVRK
jgi:hypothetical protein